MSSKSVHRFLFLILIHISWQTSFAQFDERASYLPPSPNAASILKYANTPVNMYTGVPAITADLHTLQTRGGYTVPIYLSYHASGIKVQDVASNVGIGWSISTNCLVTRLVRGLPDESASGYFGSDMGQKITGPLDVTTLNGIIDNNLDAEPDLFYFSLNGHYGKFVFDKNKNPVMLADNSIRILNSPFKRELGIDGWVLADLQGNKFYLGNDGSSIEVTQSTVYGETSYKVVPSFTSSWYLKRITTANATENIEFNYEAGNPITVTTYGKRQKSRDKITTTFNRGFYFLGIPIRKASIGEPDIETFKNEWDNNIEELITNPKYLVSITSANQSAYFIYDTQNRLDLSNGRMLNKIEIRNHRGEPTKSFGLNYNYFTSLKTPWTFEYRLKLNDVTLFSNDLSSSLSLFRFTYNEDYLFPLRNSSKTDHWGYANNNPYGYFPDDKDQALTTKMPDKDRMKTGILQKIIYPTGGYQQFLFEANEYYNQPTNSNVLAGGLRIAKIMDVGGNSTTPVVTSYSYKNDWGQSSGKLIVPKPEYVSYIEHTDGYQIPFVPLGLPPTPSGYSVPDNIVVPPGTRGDMVTQLPMKTPFIPSLIYSALPHLMGEGVSYSNVRYTPYTIKSSVALNSLFDLNGNTIGYSQVTVENSGEGKIVNTFTDMDDYTDFVNQLRVDGNFMYQKRISPNLSPYTPTTSYAFARGRLKESRVYDKNYNLLKRISNTYEIKNMADSVRGFRCAIGKINTVNGVFQSYSTAYYNIGYYSMLSKALVLKQSTEESFEPGLVPVRKTTTYAYNNTYPALLSNRNTRHSDGNNLLTEFKYVLNKDQVAYSTSSEIDAANRLFNEGRYGLLLEETTKRNNETININRVGYKNWVINSKQLLLPETTYQGNGSALGSKLQYWEYDEYGNVLQVSPNKGARVTTCWDYNKLFPIAEVRNAEPQEVLFESFENAAGAAIVSGINGSTHSGGKCYSGDYTLNFPLPNGKPYKLSYWYYAGGSWHFSGYLPYTGPSMTLTQGDGIDDVVIIPQDAAITSYTYNPAGGLSSVTDAGRATTSYRYDGFQRLTSIKDNKDNILKQFTYNDAPEYVGNVYFSSTASAFFTKNDCPESEVSAPVLYTIPGETYFSYLSQADADAKAQADLNTNGQSYANANGTCVSFADCSLTYTVDPSFTFASYKITKSFDDGKRVLCKIRLRYDNIYGTNYESIHDVQFEYGQLEADGGFQLEGGSYAEIDLIEVTLN